MCFPTKLPAPEPDPGVTILERVLNEIGHRRVGELFGKLSPGVELHSQTSWQNRDHQRCSLLLRIGKNPWSY